MCITWWTQKLKYQMWPLCENHLSAQPRSWGLVLVWQNGGFATVDSLIDVYREVLICTVLTFDVLTFDFRNPLHSVVFTESWMRASAVMDLHFYNSPNKFSNWTKQRHTIFEFFKQTLLWFKNNPWTAMTWKYFQPLAVFYYTQLYSHIFIDIMCILGIRYCNICLLVKNMIFMASIAYLRY